MLSGPAAITGQLPGRSSYAIDTEVYGKFQFCFFVELEFFSFSVQKSQ
jgi:hypothetical protein